MNKKAVIITVTLAIALAVGLLIYAFAPKSNVADKPEVIDDINYDHTVQTIDGQKYIVPNF